VLSTFYQQIFRLQKVVVQMVYCAAMKPERKDNRTQPIKSPLSGTIRVPPNNIDAEQALLGSILLRPMALHDILDRVNEDSFYVDKHRIIFSAMVELSRKSEPIDLVSLSTYLRERNMFDRIGGALYLTELTDRVPASTNIEHYALLISKKAVMRNLIRVGDELTELGFTEDREPEELLNEAEHKVIDVTHKALHIKKTRGIKDILPESWETMQRLQEHSGEFRGIPTGFRDIDNKLSGLQRSDLIILAARPSMGKTSFALDIARQTALKYNTAVGIFSLEMSSQSLVDRMLASEAQVDSWKLRTGKALSEHDVRALQSASSRLMKAPIFIDDQPGVHIGTMRSVARKLKLEHDLGLIIVDYLQLMTTTKQYDSMVNQVTEISRSLKALARELNVPVLALSQLSRAVESRGGRPRLSDLRDSGAIEQDADVVIFIHRENDLENGGRHSLSEILIEKHRNGPTGIVELNFDAAKTSFLSIDKNEMGDFGGNEPSREESVGEEFGF
jgi:replicative DNA helicase